MSKNILITAGTQTQGVIVSGSPANITTGVTFTPPIPAAAVAAAFSPTGDTMACCITGSAGNQISMYERQGNTYTLVQSLSENNTSALVFSYDGAYLVMFVGNTPYIKVYKKVAGSWVYDASLIPTASVPAGTMAPPTLAYNPVRHQFYAVSNTGSGYFFELVGGVFVRASMNPINGSPLFPPVFSPDGEYVYYTNTTTPYLRWLAARTPYTAGLTSTPPPFATTWAVSSTSGSIVVAGRTTDSAFVLFRRLGTGALALLPAATITPGVAWLGSAMSPDGKILTIRATNTLFMYAIDDAAGTATLLTLNSVPLATTTATAPALVLKISPTLFDGSAFLYKDTLRGLLSGDVKTTSLKLMLLSSASLLDMNHTTLSQVTVGGTTEATATGWPAGGVALSGVTFSKTDSGGVIMRADDLFRDITGAQSLTARRGVIYDDLHPNKQPLVMTDFGENVVVGNGERFTFDFTSNGVLAIEPS